MAYPSVSVNPGVGLGIITIYSFLSSYYVRLSPKTRKKRESFDRHTEKSSIRPEIWETIPQPDLTNKSKDERNPRPCATGIPGIAKKPQTRHGVPEELGRIIGISLLRFSPSRGLCPILPAVGEWGLLQRRRRSELPFGGEEGILQAMVDVILTYTPAFFKQGVPFMRGGRKTAPRNTFF